MRDGELLLERDGGGEVADRLFIRSNESPNLTYGTVRSLSPWERERLVGWLAALIYPHRCDPAGPGTPARHPAQAQSPARDALR